MDAAAWTIIIATVAAVCSLGTLVAMFSESNTSAGRYETICRRINLLDNKVTDANRKPDMTDRV